MRWWILALLSVLVVAGCASDEGAQTAPESPAEVGVEEVPSVEPDEASEEPTEPPPDEADPSPEPDVDGPLVATPVRAVWVHLFDDTLKSREGIATLVEELLAAEATMVIAQVARRHDAYYDSQVLPASEDPALEDGLDVLAELTDRAHAAGIEVHAWVSVAPTWHAVYDELPAPAGWVPAEHGRAAPAADRWVTRTVDGDWSEYLDPALPEVREHIVAVVEEFAERSRVDGVHLDYVRYESARHGYHPRTLERYEQETGATGVPAPDDPAFVAWRQDQTRGLIEEVRAALEQAPRRVALSAPVVTWGPGPSGLASGSFADTRTARDGLQDWPSWARAGLVDVLFPMNYFRDHEPEQGAWLEQWLEFENELATATDTLIVPGIAGWLNTREATVRQVAMATTRTDGAAVYSYQQPTDDGSREVWRELAEDAWGAG